jgi:hypothetical protein
METKLRMTEQQHKLLLHHLLPEDGGEAAAAMLCGRTTVSGIHTLLCREVITIPLEDCVVRGPDRLEWRTDKLVPLIDRASRERLAIVKLHSHPGGFSEFSFADDRADTDLFQSIHGWTGDGLPHASVVMLPGGECFGRAIHPDAIFEKLHSIEVVGHQIFHWPSRQHDASTRAFTQRHAQAFGDGTAALLGHLSVAVVGCSGTGSIVVEQLARLGVGRLVLIDPDVVEEKNLNRILHATRDDALRATPKVEVAHRGVNNMGLGTSVIPLHANLLEPDAIRAVAGCDVVFGCTDSYLARQILNRVSTFYLLPYIDVGVRLDADGKGGISEICGAVHYIRPGGDSLRQRGAIDAGGLQAESMLRTHPEEYERQVKAKYIQGARENSPAVISVNTTFSGLAVTELLARLCPYRPEEGHRHAHTGASLVNTFMHASAEGAPDPILLPYVGAGDVEPLLDLCL